MRGPSGVGFTGGHSFGREADGGGMANEVISYLEMCGREGTNLQRGMNFGLRSDHYSVVLMSVRPGAPYQDRLEDDGTTLIYEGHDEPRSDAVLEPKTVDQPYRTTHDALTQNGRFLEAARAYKDGRRALRPSKKTTLMGPSLGYW